MQAQPGHDPRRQPVLIESGTDDGRVNKHPTKPFLLRHQPRSVVFETIKVNGKDQGYWLPALKPFTLWAGTNGIKLGQGEGPDYHYAKSEAERKGKWVFLKQDETWQGQPVLSSYKCRSPENGELGTFHCTLFDTPVESAGEKEDELHHDDEQDARWRHSLVLAGKLPVPSKKAITSRLNQAEKRLRRLGMKVNGNAQVESEFKAWEALVLLMRTAIVPGVEGDPLVSTETKGAKRAS
jgi:hypothetical protein